MMDYRRLLYILGKYGQSDVHINIDEATDEPCVDVFCQDCGLYGYYRIEEDDLDLLEQCLLELSATDDFVGSIFGTQYFVYKVKKMALPKDLVYRISEWGETQASREGIRKLLEATDAE